jgi:hypothetical protein
VSGVAGQIEQHGHRFLAEDGAVGGGHADGRSRLFQPLVEHETRR